MHWPWRVLAELFCGLYSSGHSIIQVTEKGKTNMLMELILTDRTFLSIKPGPECFPVNGIIIIIFFQEAHGQDFFPTSLTWPGFISIACSGLEWFPATR